MLITLSNNDKASFDHTSTIKYLVLYLNGLFGQHGCPGRSLLWSGKLLWMSSRWRDLVIWSLP